MTEELNTQKKTDYNDDFEIDQNLIGLLNLLWQEDRRQNPHLYKKPDNEN